MNERLGLQDLVDLLAKKQGITKKDAENFLRELFDLVSECIGNNELVRIKDFGTFKVIKVGSRKSVDVNTGEAIEIPAHYKLSFAVEKGLKEAINKPFDHFETVLLEDGVSFENIESDIKTELSDDDTDHGALEKESNHVTGFVPQDNFIIENQEEVASIGAHEVEEHIDVIEAEKAIYIEDDTLTSQPDIMTDFPQIINDQSIDSEIQDREAQVSTEESKSSNKKYIWAIIATVVIAGAIVGIFFLEDVQKTVKQDDVEVKIEVPPVVKDTIQTQNASPAVINANQKDSMETLPENRNGSVKENVLSQDGLKAIGMETIESGHTLRLISLKYYGNKSFWVYIYQDNPEKIKNPNNVPLGTKLIIPSPKKYDIDAHNPESVKKARQLETEILRKHDIH